MAKAPSSATKTRRSRQLLETYRMAKKSDRRIGQWILLAFVVAAPVGFALFWLLPGSGVFAWVLGVLGGLLFGVLAGTIVFGQRAQKAAYVQMDGQPGAAAAALGMLRRGWTTTPVIGFTKQQDIVHRVVGPPGIVLVGEGNPHRLRPLMLSERRKHERVVAEVPIHEIVCGHGPGEVPLAKLVRTVNKLGRKVRPAEITDILARLKALDANRPTVPMPRGPMPTSMKGMRQNMRGR